MTEEKIRFAKPEPPKLRIPSRNELIARGFIEYIKRCEYDEEAIYILSNLLDEVRRDD